MKLEDIEKVAELHKQLKAATTFNEALRASGRCENNGVTLETHVKEFDYGVGGTSPRQRTLRVSHAVLWDWSATYVESLKKQLEAYGVAIQKDQK